MVNRFQSLLRGVLTRPREEKYSFATPSPVRVCFTGNPSAGSWTIRGRQIAACRLNWSTAHRITRSDLERFDLFCIVKHVVPETLDLLRSLRKPFVFDVVDSWAQPEDGLRFTDVAAARELFGPRWRTMGARGFIFPNRAMEEDLGSLTPHCTHIYHHYRPELSPRPLRPRPTTIAYEGDPRFLGPWKEIVERIGSELGLEFVVNPEDLSRVDIGFAARGGPHDSFLANRYKSNVKLANFYGAAIPCVVSRKEQAYRETDEGSVLFFDDAAELRAHLGRLMALEERQRIRERFLAARETFRIERIAGQFEAFFLEVLERSRRPWA